MTDKLTGRKLVEKTFSYVVSLTKEGRRPLTMRFERDNRGIPFDTAEALVTKEIESWFANRDRNLQIRLEKSIKGKAGEIFQTYTGATKDARFKIHADAIFTLTDQSNKASPSYLKNLNLYADERDFSR